MCLTSKIKPKLGALARLSKCLPRAELDSIYKTTIQPYIDYGIIILGHHSQCNLNMVEKFQNRAARLVTRNFDYLTSSSEIIKSLKWLTRDSFTQQIFSCSNAKMVLPLNPLTRLQPNGQTFMTILLGIPHNYSYP